MSKVDPPSPVDFWGGLEYSGIIDPIIDGEQLLLGEGGYSKVYKGKVLSLLPDMIQHNINIGDEIALKRISHKKASLASRLHELRILKSVSGNPFITSYLGCIDTSDYKNMRHVHSQHSSNTPNNNANTNNTTDIPSSTPTTTSGSTNSNNIDALSMPPTLTILLEYIKQDSFRYYFHEMTLHDIKLYLYALLSALKHIHSKGLIHRDIKPGNFLHKVGVDVYKLADFGLADTEHEYRKRYRSSEMDKMQNISKLLSSHRSHSHRSGGGVRRLNPHGILRGGSNQISYEQTMMNTLITITSTHSFTPPLLPPQVSLQYNESLPPLSSPHPNKINQDNPAISSNSDISTTNPSLPTPLSCRTLRLPHVSLSTTQQIGSTSFDTLISQYYPSDISQLLYFKRSEPVLLSLTYPKSIGEIIHYNKSLVQQDISGIIHGPNSTILMDTLKHKRSSSSTIATTTTTTITGVHGGGGGGYNNHSTAHNILRHQSALGNSNVHNRIANQLHKHQSSHKHNTNSNNTISQQQYLNSTALASSAMMSGLQSANTGALSGHNSGHTYSGLGGSGLPRSTSSFIPGPSSHNNNKSQQSGPQHPVQHIPHPSLAALGPSKRTTETTTSNPSSALPSSTLIYPPSSYSLHQQPSLQLPLRPKSNMLPTFVPTKNQSVRSALHAATSSLSSGLHVSSSNTSFSSSTKQSLPNNNVPTINGSTAHLNRSALMNDSRSVTKQSSRLSIGTNTDKQHSRLSTDKPSRLSTGKISSHIADKPARLSSSKHDKASNDKDQTLTGDSRRVSSSSSTVSQRPSSRALKVPVSTTNNAITSPKPRKSDNNTSRQPLPAPCAPPHVIPFSDDDISSSSPLYICDIASGTVDAQPHSTNNDKNKTGGRTGPETGGDPRRRRSLSHKPAAPHLKQPKLPNVEAVDLISSRLNIESLPPGLQRELHGIKHIIPPPDVTRAGTRGFRAPEILLHVPTPQTTKIDIWSVGIILLSIMIKRYPLFLCNDDLGALYEIMSVLGYTTMDVNGHSVSILKEKVASNKDGIMSSSSHQPLDRESDMVLPSSVSISKHLDPTDGPLPPPLPQPLCAHATSGAGSPHAPLLAPLPHADSIPPLPPHRLILGSKSSRYEPVPSISPEHRRKCFHAFIHEASGGIEWPGELLDLLDSLLTIDPNDRISAEDALKHPFFTQLDIPEYDTYLFGPRHPSLEYLLSPQYNIPHHISNAQSGDDSTSSQLDTTPGDANSLDVATTSRYNLALYKYIRNKLNRHDPIILALKNKVKNGTVSKQHLRAAQCHNYIDILDFLLTSEKVKVPRVKGKRIRMKTNTIINNNDNNNDMGDGQTLVPSTAVVIDPNKDNHSDKNNNNGDGEVVVSDDDSDDDDDDDDLCDQLSNSSSSISSPSDEFLNHSPTASGEDRILDENHQNHSTNHDTNDDDDDNVQEEHELFPNLKQCSNDDDSMIEPLVPDDLNDSPHVHHDDALFSVPGCDDDDDTVVPHTKFHCDNDQDLHVDIIQCPVSNNIENNNTLHVDDLANSQYLDDDDDDDDDDDGNNNENNAMDDKELATLPSNFDSAILADWIQQGHDMTLYDSDPMCDDIHSQHSHSDQHHTSQNRDILLQNPLPSHNIDNEPSIVPHTSQDLLLPQPLDDDLMFDQLDNTSLEKVIPFSFQPVTALSLRQSLSRASSHSSNARLSSSTVLDTPSDAKLNTTQHCSVPHSINKSNEITVIDHTATLVSNDQPHKSSAEPVKSTLRISSIVTSHGTNSTPQQRSSDDQDDDDTSDDDDTRVFDSSDHENNLPLARAGLKLAKILPLGNGIEDNSVPNSRRITRQLYEALTTPIKSSKKAAKRDSPDYQHSKPPQTTQHRSRKQTKVEPDCCEFSDDNTTTSRTKQRVGSKSKKHSNEDHSSSVDDNKITSSSSKHHTSVEKNPTATATITNKRRQSLNRSLDNELASACDDTILSMPHIAPIESSLSPLDEKYTATPSHTTPSHGASSTPSFKPLDQPSQICDPSDPLTSHNDTQLSLLPPTLSASSSSSQPSLSKRVPSTPTRLNLGWDQLQASKDAKASSCATSVSNNNNNSIHVPVRQPNIPIRTPSSSQSNPLLMYQPTPLSSKPSGQFDINSYPLFNAASKPIASTPATPSLKPLNSMVATTSSLSTTSRLSQSKGRVAADWSTSRVGQPRRPSLLLAVPSKSVDPVVSHPQSPVPPIGDQDRVQSDVNIISNDENVTMCTNVSSTRNCMDDTDNNVNDDNDDHDDPAFDDDNNHSQTEIQFTPRRSSRTSKRVTDFSKFYDDEGDTKEKRRLTASTTIKTKSEPKKPVVDEPRVDIDSPKNEPIKSTKRKSKTSIVPPSTPGLRFSSRLSAAALSSSGTPHDSPRQTPPPKITSRSSSSKVAPELAKPSSQMSKTPSKSSTNAPSKSTKTTPKPSQTPSKLSSKRPRRGHTNNDDDDDSFDIPQEDTPRVTKRLRSGRTIDL